MNMQRCPHGLRLALLVCAFVAPGCPANLPAPNVVLISLDTVRADELPLYGYQRDTSPALGALAAQGAVFENAYAQAPNTVATHASMFTGRYPFQHGMYRHGESLAAEENTLAEIMASHGYRTFGLASSVRFPRDAGYDQGFEVYETFYDLAKNDRADRITERALELAERAGSKPFFAFLHYFGAHGPYTAPEPYRSQWHPGLEVPAPEATVDYMMEFRWPGQSLAPGVLEYLRALYDAGLRHQDEALGRLFEGLRGRSNSRPTLVIVTADHGEEFKEHGFLMHSHFLHEELVRVPFIVHWPGRIAAGRRIATPTQTVDLLPTILGLLGLPQPSELPGRSLAPLLLGDAGSREEPLEDPADIVVLEAFPSWGIIATLRSGRFKWVEGRGRGLFRLDEDPTADREVSQRYPGEKARLLTLARDLGLPAAVRLRAGQLGEKRHGSRPDMGRVAPEEREILERLRALSSGHLPQDAVEDPAVAVVIDLDKCIDAASRFELDEETIGAGGPDRYLLPRFESVVDFDVKVLAAVQPQGIR